MVWQGVFVQSPKVLCIMTEACFSPAGLRCICTPVCPSPAPWSWQEALLWSLRIPPSQACSPWRWWKPSLGPPISPWTEAKHWFMRGQINQAGMGASQMMDSQLTQVRSRTGEPLLWSRLIHSHLFLRMSCNMSVWTKLFVKRQKISLTHCFVNHGFTYAAPYLMRWLLIPCLSLLRCHFVTWKSNLPVLHA